MIEIQVMHDSSEVIYYNTPDLPVKIIHPSLSDYPGRRVVCHWHEDIELIYIVKGEMNYEINGKTVRLPEHSALFVNARQLHYGFSEGGADCGGRGSGGAFRKNVRGIRKQSGDHPPASLLRDHRQRVPGYEGHHHRQERSDEHGPASGQLRAAPDRDRARTVRGGER